MADSVVTVSLRQSDGLPLEDRPWAAVPLGLCSGTPWRTFRWYRGQKHYSGAYWSATTGNLVVYESRLELARVLFADFDPTVCGIMAQPFLLKSLDKGTVRRHIPDYLLLTDHGPMVVDVKPRHQQSSPMVATAFTWTRRAVESRGWRYEVWGEPPEAELANVRFLAGFRREWLFAHGLLDELLRAGLDGTTITEATRCQPRWPEPCARAAIHHLLWRHDLHTDLTQPLQATTVLRGTT